MRYQPKLTPSPTLPTKELQHIYAALGRALWHLQYVEEALNALLTVKHHIGGAGRVTEKEASSILQQRLRKTMGPSVKLAREVALLPGNELDRLERLLDKRNWVAHKVQRSVGDQVLLPRGRLDLLQKLNAITAESQTSLNALITEMQSFVGSTGHGVRVPAHFTALMEADRFNGIPPVEDVNPTDSEAHPLR